jgi:hypothetical protein
VLDLLKRSVIKGFRSRPAIFQGTFYSTELRLELLVRAILNRTDARTQPNEWEPSSEDRIFLG